MARYEHNSMGFDHDNRRFVGVHQCKEVLFETSDDIRKAAKAKSEFMARMSHELRTPLNVIIGFAELMLDEIPGKINEEQRRSLDDIRNSGKHLLKLIDDIVDQSGMESGKIEK